MSDNDAAGKVRESLRMVIDPELGESVVDLGLIYSIEVSAEGIAIIEMTTTTRGCPAAAFLKEAVSSAAWFVPEVNSAEVRVTYEPPWTPEMISAQARRRLGLAQEKSGLG